jgi:hypothetical protein
LTSVAPISETDRAREAFEQAWRVLAPNVEQAKAVRAQAATNPDLLTDPNNQALVKWLDAFEKQLVALDSFHDATSRADPSLNVVHLGDVQLARDTADELYNTLQEARGLLSSSSGTSAS